MQARSKEEEQGEAGDESSPEQAKEDSSDGDQEEDREEKSEGEEESPAQDEPSDDDAHLGSPDDASDAGEMCSQCGHDDDDETSGDEDVNQKVVCRDDDGSGAETLVLGSLDQDPVNHDGSDASDRDTQPDSPGCGKPMHT